MERTLVILKPDAVQRRLCGRILAMFEQKGLKIVGMKIVLPSRPLIEKHYAAHRGKKFYDSLLRFMTSGPIVLLALEGFRAIDIVRKLMGSTFGAEAEPGTIRGELAISNQFNLVHGSDSPESAARELELFFEPGEILSYPMGDEEWLAGGN